MLESWDLAGHWEEAAEHWSQHDFRKMAFKKEKYFSPFKEIAFENLEISEKCKSTSISFDQEVTVAGVREWSQVSLLQGSELLWVFAVLQFLCAEWMGCLSETVIQLVPGAPLPAL